MKLYIFSSGEQFVKLKIDRIEKKLEIATASTNYRFLPQPYWKLFGDKPGDKEQAMVEMAETELLNDHDFEAKLKADMAKIGYILLKCQ